MTIVKKTCLTLDCTDFNPNGPGRVRPKAENPDLQTCYFNVANDNHMFNVFISKHINKDVDNNEINFEIEDIKSQMNNETFNAELELDNLSENGAANAGSSQFGFGIIMPEMQDLLGNQGLNRQENQLDQNFCLDHRDNFLKKIGKIKTPKNKN